MSAPHALVNAHPVMLASTRVAGIVELVEQTLLALANLAQENTSRIWHVKVCLRTLLLAQGVSRTFRDTIATSPGLQKALFLTPPIEGFWNDDTTLNPLFARFLQVSDTYWSTVLLTREIGTAKLFVTLSDTTPTNTSFEIRREQSWRRMYLGKGEYYIMFVGVQMQKYGLQKTCSCRAILENPTLGQVVDLASPALAKWEDGPHKSMAKRVRLGRGSNGTEIGSRS